MTWESVEADFSCRHAAEELRYKLARNGVKMYVYQCLSCGEAVSTWQQEPDDGFEPDEFDQALQDENRKYKEEAHAADYEEKLTKLQEEGGNRAVKYDDYIRTSPKWKKRRALVLKRANHLCECCLSAKATAVHHENYDTLFNEVLWDLRAVCRPCHKKIHGLTP